MVNPTQLLSPVAAVRRKIDIYRSYDVRVQPGGLFMEIAKKQGKDRDLVKRFVDLGFDMVEISSTTSTRTEMSADLEMVTYAKANGLTVVGEVGRKFADGDETRLTEDTIDIETTVREFKELLDAGAWKVYWEGHLLRQGTRGRSGNDQAARGYRDLSGQGSGPDRRRVQYYVRGLWAPPPR